MTTNGLYRLASTPDSFLPILLLLSSFFPTPEAFGFDPDPRLQLISRQLAIYFHLLAMSSPSLAMSSPSLAMFSPSLAMSSPSLSIYLLSARLFVGFATAVFHLRNPQ